MFELTQAGENSYYIKGPANIGLWLDGNRRAWLIDSGNDKEAGRKLRQLLDRQGWPLAAILNTHSNADHVGGNKYLQTQTNCPVYAPGAECAFTRHTLLEPAFLYGGYPPRDLRHKFLLPQESRADYLTPEVLPPGLSLVPLPGHFFDMVGFRTADDVVYLADCLSGAETLAKYQISFLFDVAAYLDTLERVKQMQARLFVPAHAAATRDIAPLAQLNMDQVGRIAEQILAICRNPACFEQILKQLFDIYGLSMNFEQYVLVGSTVRSYLAWLRDRGELAAEFSDNMLLWRRN